MVGTAGGIVVGMTDGALTGTGIAVIRGAPISTRRPLLSLLRPTATAILRRRLLSDPDRPGGDNANVISRRLREETVPRVF